MRPILNYYGSKWRLATSYPPPLPGLPLVEPFAGGAGFSLRLDDGRREVWLYDADPVVAEFWRGFLAATPADILDIPLCGPDLRVPDGLDGWARSLIGWNVNVGISSPRTRGSGYMRGKPSRGFWSAGRRDDIAASRAQMGDRWRFGGSDYRAAPDVEATWFVDPPYQAAPGRLYPTDFSAHAELGQWCQTRRGLVIACDLVGADWLPFEPHAIHYGARTVKDMRRQTVEAIWTRGAAQQTLWGLR